MRMANEVFPKSSYFLVYKGHFKLLQGIPRSLGSCHQTTELVELYYFKALDHQTNQTCSTLLLHNNIYIMRYLIPKAMSLAIFGLGPALWHVHCALTGLNVFHQVGKPST